MSFAALIEQHRGNRARLVAMIEGLEAGAAAAGPDGAPPNIAEPTAELLHHLSLSVAALDLLVDTYKSDPNA